MRKLWIRIHLYVAAFFLPMLLAMATSGGLYLNGIKGAVVSTPVSLTVAPSLSADSTTLDDDRHPLIITNS